MAQPQDSYKITDGFFHAASKRKIETNQYVFESIYKSAHTVTMKDIWAEEIPYCATILESDAVDPTIVQKYTQVALTQIPGSNGESFYLNDGGKFIKNWISPVDVPHSTTNEPSYGFQVRIYRDSGVEISPSEGVWVADYYAGIINFQSNYKPSLMGYGNITITVYVYVGETLQDSGGIVELNRKVVEIPFTSGSSIQNSSDIISVNDYVTDVYFKLTEVFDAPTIIDISLNGTIPLQLMDNSEIDPGVIGAYSKEDIFKVLTDQNGNVQLNITSPGSTTGAGVLYVIYITLGSDSKYTNLNPTEISVGGINIGSTFNQLTYSEMFDLLLYPELFPTLVAPDNTFVLIQDGFQEIGDTINLNFISTFSRGSITPPYSTSGNRSGLPSSYNYIGSILPATSVHTGLTDIQNVAGYVVVGGSQAWSNTVTYAVGEQPLSNKGNNFDTPLPGGTTAAKNVEIIGVYPYFANTVDITIMTKQPLASHSSEYIEISVVGESGGNKQSFELPTVWSAITGIQQYNTFSDTWDWLSGNKLLSITSFTSSAIVKSINSVNVNYNKYTHNGANIGARSLRIFTV